MERLVLPFIGCIVGIYGIVKLLKKEMSGAIKPTPGMCLIPCSGPCPPGQRTLLLLPTHARQKRGLVSKDAVRVVGPGTQPQQLCSRGRGGAEGDLQPQEQGGGLDRAQVADARVPGGPCPPRVFPL